MPGAIALTALTYGGNNIHNEAGGIYFWIENGLFEGMTVRGGDIVIPGKDGLIKGNRKKSTRVIELMGNVFGTDPDPATRAGELITRLTTITPWFAMTARKTMVATLQGGAVYTLADCIVLNIIPQYLTPDFARVSVEVESVVPEWTVS